jgi:hypothetical protein
LPTLGRPTIPISIGHATYQIRTLQVLEPKALYILTFSLLSFLSVVSENPSHSVIPAGR